MSVYTSAKYKGVYQFDFVIKGHRSHGSTGCTSRREAERYEAVERDKVKAFLKAQARSKVSLAINDVADRFWMAEAQHFAEADATMTNLARLVEYFGRATPLTDIDHVKTTAMVAWRRGQRVSRRGKRTKAQEEALPLVSNATVNRSAVAVLRQLFTFAKTEGARFDHEPKWKDLFLPEPEERVRELQDEELASINASMRDDYAPFIAFALSTGLRFREIVTLRWSEVNFGTKQIVRLGKGGRRVVVEITSTVRKIIFPLQGQHPDFVFSYVAMYGNKRLGRVRGQRYPLTINGAKTAWQRLRSNAGLKDFRFHDFRHDFGTKVLRESGGNFKLAQKALNHRDIKSTLRYAHVLREDVAEVMERVAVSRLKSRAAIRKVS